MRLLLDENLSPAISGYLIEAGYDVVHVRDRGLASASDDMVLALAATEERVLIAPIRTLARCWPGPAPASRRLF